MFSHWNRNLVNRIWLLFQTWTRDSFCSHTASRTIPVLTLFNSPSTIRVCLFCIANDMAADYETISQSQPSFLLKAFSSNPFSFSKRWPRPSSATVFTWVSSNFSFNVITKNPTEANRKQNSQRAMRQITFFIRMSKKNTHTLFILTWTIDRTSSHEWKRVY